MAKTMDVTLLFFPKRGWCSELSFSFSLPSDEEDDDDDMAAIRLASAALLRFNST